MKRWVPYAVLGAGALTLAISAGITLLSPSHPICVGWIDPTMPAQIRAVAKPIESMTNMKGLGDFLAGVAWIESRGNPKAGSDSGNAARGLFGMRPESARVDDLGLSPSALKDRNTAVALAAWYMERCRPFADPGQTIDYLALRRCWGQPSDVDDVGSADYVQQFAQGLRCAGVDPSFMFRRPFRWNYRWPGIEAILTAVGRPLGSQKLS